MSKPTIYFITTNEFKFKSFIEAIKLDTYDIERLAIETPEIQADNNRAVATYSAEWAANTHNRPVITEDVGMYIKALNGFPGPFLSQAEKKLGAEGFLTLLENKRDREAYWEYAVAYCEPGKKPVSFHAIQKGSITKVQVGTVGWPMGKIFVQEGQTETISLLLEKEAYVRNNSHYTQLRDYLSSRH
ncbi:MAG TPA: non-canonical purine NTP pyrophosphatase [Candidatus Saccharimonadales bacterium]|jgi:XTP/dITP diphosphohydrolase